MSKHIKKFKISFFLDDRDLKVDLSKPQKGNPGIGGTEYLMVSTPFYLKKYKAKNFNLIIYHLNKNTQLPPGIKSVNVKNKIEALVHAKKNNVDLFIYRPLRDPEKELIDKINNLQINSVAWLHVTPKPNHIRSLSKSKYIKAAICVEHEQHDQLYDSPLLDKLTFIRNGFDVKAFSRNVKEKNKKKLVIFIGALFPQKNFHYLAKHWPAILKNCPNAKLKVIGSSKVYSNHRKLGKYKLADKNYENKFIKYLLDENGKLFPSVNFLGKMGLEKKKIMSYAKVGVGNPIGTNENCPGVLIEFQSLGIPVVSLENYGSIDTIVHEKTGYLAKNDDQFVNYISGLLNNENKIISKNCKKFIESKYEYSKVSTEWLKLITALKKNHSFHKSMKSNYYKHFKWFIFFNSIIQKLIGRYVKWPFLIEIKQYYSRLL